jgi:lactate 2-monooxygenase
MEAGAAPHFGDYYREIYARGTLAGEKPALPMAWRELEDRAAEALDPVAVAYVWGGAGSEDTMRANREAFRRWRIAPRFLRDVSARDLGTTVLGTEMPAPVMLAPIGVQKIVHDDAEPASARAAGELGLPFVTSTASATSLEEIAEANGESPRWYQLYWPNDDAVAKSMVERAERAGYAAIVVTVDNFIPGWSRATCGRRSSRSSREWGSPSTSPTRCSARRSRSLRTRTSGRRSVTSSPCSAAPSSPGTTSAGFAT